MRLDEYLEIIEDQLSGFDVVGTVSLEIYYNDYCTIGNSGNKITLNFYPRKRQEMLNAGVTK